MFDFYIVVCVASVAIPTREPNTSLFHLGDGAPELERGI